MVNNQRNTRQREEKGQANRSRLSPYPAPSPGNASQQRRPPLSRAQPLAHPTHRPQPQPRSRPRPRPETDLLATSPHATQSIIEHLLQASLFAADDALLTRRILTKSAPLSTAADSAQYRDDHGISSYGYTSRRSLLEFYTRFAGLYTALRGVQLRLDCLRALWNQILACRASVVRMWNLGRPVPVPEPSSAVSARQPGGAPQTPQTRTKFQPDPRLIHDFLTAQADWTPSEVTSYLRSSTALEAPLARTENHFQDAIDAFFAFAGGLAGGTPEASASASAPLLNWNIYIETQAAYDPDLLLLVERVVMEPLLLEVTGVERQFWFIGRKCPDWEIRERGQLLRRYGVAGSPEEWWIVETAEGVSRVDMEYRASTSGEIMSDGGGYEITRRTEAALQVEVGVGVDWAAVDAALMREAKERERELEDLEREIAEDLEREKERAEQEWFREPGVNRHTRRKAGLPRSQKEKQREMDKVFRQEVFMYEDHDCVRAWLARGD